MPIRLLDYDAVTGANTFHEYDPVTKDTHIHTVFADRQTDLVLDDNKRLQNDGTNGWSPTREWKYVANIPNSVIHEWKVNRGIDVFDQNDWPKVRQLLNSSDYRHLRTSLGAI